METTGTKGMIQVSMATADLLIAAGKKHWVTPRIGVSTAPCRLSSSHSQITHDKPSILPLLKKLVSVKGKGEMQTFWVEPSQRRSVRDINGELMSSAASDVSIQDTDSDRGVNNRLIEWNVELLYGYLQKLVLHRSASKSMGRPRLNAGNSMASLGSLADDEGTIMRTGGIVIEEFADVIEVPRYDSRAARKLSLSEDAKFDEVVYSQLKEYVMRIASMYRAETAFHNFEVRNSKTDCKTLTQQTIPTHLIGSSSRLVCFFSARGPCNHVH
jgi:hypothetical protein